MNLSFQDTTSNAGSTSTSTSSIPDKIEKQQEIGRAKAFFTKIGMMSYIASMCIALPLTLLPTALLHKAGLISTNKKEHLSLRTGQFCSRWLMRIIPFANVQVIKKSNINSNTQINNNNNNNNNIPEPSIWVCNHISMLDVFVLLAKDKTLRGKNKRPIKIVYWKDLEKNPVTKILFKMSGFIPVKMADNGNGKANAYDTSSFRLLLKSIKQAFKDGFDIGILPEGQLNPTPENGLQPVFSGAYTLAKMSRRPIKMMGLHGLHKLWHPDENIGMKVTGRKVSITAYPIGRRFESGEEFVNAFQNVVGYFGAHGTDLPNWERWFDGTEWKNLQRHNRAPGAADTSN
eukprot:CAMPEP_0184855980 /NCGR_PEP_ID=MMETSP0580-20130426/1137_1 /TAXON_ID=1118495 /ORGANISM="Dactyliosolen fragilissimus" /LENGTH=344 /DNA_ID=CAMNT_0027350705 /DNA_START=607 /DNA_END=1641 /DNA_ORIENTATION=-